MAEMLKLAQSVLASQPFSVFVGAQVSHFSMGKTELILPLTAEHKQQHGFVHGGVLSYMADNALTFVGGSVLGPRVVTSEYKVNYVRPAIGEKLIAKAEAVYTGKTQAVCRCDVYVLNEGEEQLCAVAQGTIAKIGD